MSATRSQVDRLLAVLPAVGSRCLARVAHEGSLSTTAAVAAAADLIRDGALEILAGRGSKSWATPASVIQLTAVGRERQVAVVLGTGQAA